MSIYIGEPVVVSDMQGPCNDGFHVPLKSEWEGVISIWNALGLGSTAGTNFSTYLKLPFTGFRAYNNTNLTNQGTYGYYRSSEQRSSDNRAYWLFVGPSGADSITIGSFYKGGGSCIRPFKDTFVVPTSGWTVIAGTLGSGGIFWNKTDGIISITSNGSTGYTISDKNLGATTVWNSGDTLSQNNCGYYYQWGNNYGFAFTGTISDTSTTKIDASTYGPGNYYSSNIWIKQDEWDSSNNDNLRGGVSQGTSTKSVEVKNIYIGEKPYEGPLRFTANTAGSTVQLTQIGNPTAVTLETSTDGTNWSTYTIGNTITLSNVGDAVYFRNSSEAQYFNVAYNRYYKFVMTGSIAGSGDVNYLLNKNSTTTLVGAYCFTSLFSGCASLTTPPQLPATTLTNNCYESMFYNCTGLTQTPQLPATTLTQNCYSSMFSECSSLETLPALPATNLAYGCYGTMFYNCSKIKLSTTQTGEYQTPYRIPTEGTGTEGTYSLEMMFNGTGGTFVGQPSINTTYYTSNTVV